jgi:hypothetical protein
VYRSTIPGVVAKVTCGATASLKPDIVDTYVPTEARDYGFIDEIVGSFGQVMRTRKHRIGLKGAS